MTLLTTREHEVMQHVCEGLTAQGIGERMHLSSRTVEIHRSNAIRKLGARNQVHAAVLFTRRQLHAGPSAPAPILHALCDEIDGDCS